MNYLLLFKILIITTILQLGQPLDNNFEFKDGIFINFTQVRKNAPIPREKIITAIPKDDFNFYENLLKEKYITFIDSNGRHKIETNQIWGFCDQGSLYINWRGDFAKILTKGFIGYFVATEKVTYYQTPTSVVYYDYPSYPQTTQEMRQYIINFDTGEILDFSPKSLLLILEKHDKNLYEEYQNLSKRKKKKLLFFYIRKFNDLHKIIIPKY